MAREVVMLGEALLAFVADEDGPLHEAHRFTGHVVGAEVNAAIAVQRLGHGTAFVGRVGADGLGVAVRRRLLAEGVDAGHLATDLDAPTGTLIRTRTGLRAAEVIYHRRGSAGSRLSPTDVDAARSTITGARWLHVSGITPALSDDARAATARAVALAREAGVTVSLDLNLRRQLWTVDAARAALLPLLRDADVVFCGLDEAAVLFGAGDPSGAVAALLAEGAGTAVVRDGARGTIAQSVDGAPVEHVPERVAVIDGIGAGDAFDGGYIAASLEGAGAAEAVALGEICKSYALSAIGDVEGLPTRAEARAALEGTTDVLR